MTSQQLQEAAKAQAVSSNMVSSHVLAELERAFLAGAAYMQGQPHPLEQGILKFLQWMKDNRSDVAGLGAPISMLEELLRDRPVQAQSAGVWVKASDGFPTQNGNYFMRHQYEDGRWHGWWTYVAIQVINKDYWIKMGYEWLSGSPTTGGESEAVRFAEWCATQVQKEAIRFIESGLWADFRKKWFVTTKTITTSELYAIYKESLI